ncbi:hypothetical protein [Streptomyces pseudovenezuelae]|nr:hypothetical protein [Streptomyces pseudovenezuelae]
MSRGEEADESSTEGTHFEVVIAGDGSAAIDGSPVPAARGETVDAAILDTLHAYARDRNTTVTADISDPSADYVAHVEVAPDGSSRLLEEHRQDAPEPTEATLVPIAEDDEDDDFDDAHDPDDPDDLHDDPDDDLTDFDDDLTEESESESESYTLPDPTEPPPPLTPSTSSTTPGPTVPRPLITRGNHPRQSDDEYEGPGLLHRPLVVGPVALSVAALVVVPLVILGSKAPADGGNETQAARTKPDSTATGTPLPPRPSPTYSTIPTAVPTSPNATATTRKPGPKKTSTPNGGGGIVTVTARPPQVTVTAKPPKPVTAATAVQRLARNDPHGRHICYRAYVSGQGWQKPVCDGATAGRPGKKKPIKALNIAVSNAGGSAANAFVHDPASTNGEGKWKPEWTDLVADGGSNYIGSAKKSAPNLLAFAINIGSGRICQSGKVHGSGWSARSCAGARPDLLTVGTFTNNSYLEAVKLTV